MPKATYTLQKLCCPVCNSDEVGIASVVKLVPLNGSNELSYPISIYQDNRVVVKDTPVPIRDFVGQRLALSFRCHRGDHVWTILVAEHYNQCYSTQNPVCHQAEDGVEE